MWNVSYTDFKSKFHCLRFFFKEELSGNSKNLTGGRHDNFVQNTPLMNIGDLRATLPKILIFNFHPEIDFAHNSSINFTWQVGNKYEIISEKLNFFKMF